MVMIVQKDADALTWFYDRYIRFVFSISLRIAGHNQIAEEVALDVFERVWVKADTYRAERGEVKSWLARLTRNLAIDRLRREKSRPELTAISWTDWFEDKTSHQPTVEGAAAHTLRNLRVREAIDQLPQDQKEALAYAFFGGYSHQEIAVLLDLPLGTVKTRLRLAMKKLYFLLREEL